MLKQVKWVLSTTAVGLIWGSAQKHIGGEGEAYNLPGPN